MIPPANLLSSFTNFYHQPPTLIAYAPGRVNLLGGHTDYNDGWVLPVAIDRYAWLATRPTSSGEVRIHALDLAETVTINIHQLDDKLDTQSRPLPKWAHYPAGVAWSLQRHDLSLAGFDAVLTSTVPVEAGLSSSAAIEVAFAVTWESITGWQVDRMSLARLCQSAENLYVGVNSGLMDQFASLHGVAGNALFFDCRTLEWETVPLPENVALVIADTNVRRSLGDSSYNERRAACEEAVRILSEHLPNITALRDVEVHEFETHQHLLPPVIRRRAEHVVRECARTLRGVEKLQAGDVSSFGTLMIEGNASLRDLYEVSCPELNALIEIATSLPGCYGSRLTGAGFGGCTVNLVEQAHAESFAHGLSTTYKKRTGKDATVWICQAAEGAGVIERDIN
jgi:galactokinase